MDVLGVIVDSPITVVQTAEKRSAYSVGYHYLGVQKFAPKGWIGGIAFTWGNLYTRFAKQVMDGTWKSENILGGLERRLPDHRAVRPRRARRRREARGREEAGLHSPARAKSFQGPIRDNKGVERVKAGEAFPLTELAQDGLAGRGRDRPAK